MIALTDEAVRDGGLVIRRARKEHRCTGTQGGGRHVAGCPEVIHAGEVYLECYWNVPAFTSGDRWTEACALGLGPTWVRAVEGGS